MLPIAKELWGKVLKPIKSPISLPNSVTRKYKALAQSGFLEAHSQYQRAVWS